MARTCTVPGPDKAIEIGGGGPLVVIAGPCALESRELAMEVGGVVRDACRSLGLGYIFKASFDKANRSSVESPRGPGLEEGLGLLGEIRRELGVPVTTDVHHPEQAGPAAGVVDVLQVPAFLCRQTDLLAACGRAASASGRCVNVKKGQFLAPSEMRGPVGKLAEVGCGNVLLTERGTFFGYHRLVTDLIGLGDLMELDVEGGSPPVCFDATHSAQLPGAGSTTSGRRERIPMLALAAAAAGVDALFLECHPTPERGLSDASTMLPLAQVTGLLERVSAVRAAARGT